MNCKVSVITLLSTVALSWTVVIDAAYAACIPSQVNSKIQLFKSGSCLRGANMFQGEQYAQSGQVWNPIIVQQDLTAMRSSGSNLVNYSIPGPYDVSSYQRRADFFARMDQLVSYAKNADLFVILSFRTGPGRPETNITGGQSNALLYSNSAAQTAFANMWKEVAQRYMNEKNVIGYDILVEPNGVSRSAWRGIANQVIAAIRSVDANTPILVSPDNWGVVGSLSGWTPLTGTNLIYTAHQYEPFEYTHYNQSANWSSALDNIYQTVLNWQTQNNATVMINEFGITNSSANNGQFMQKQIDLLERSGLNHAAWIWEVEYDPSYTFRVMDFKRNSVVFAPIRNSWLNNSALPSTVTFSGPAPMPTPTPNPPPTPGPLVISSIAVNNRTTTTATISWTTNEASTTLIEYSLNSNLSNKSQYYSASAVKNHTRRITGLLPNRVYYYRVSSLATSGGYAISTIRSFRTSASGARISGGGR